MGRLAKNNSGFTLIEVVLSLIMFIFISIVAGMGVVSFTKGIIFAKKSSSTAQKVQLAMTRLNREFMEITDIAARDDDQPYIIYDNISGRRAIAKDGSVIKMFFNLPADQTELPASGDNILTDNIHSLAITYYKDYQAGQTWLLAEGIDLLTAIQIELEITDVGGKFSTIVFPRNR